MVKYILKRLLAAIVTIFVIATLTFFLMQLLPGGPFNTEQANPKTVEIMNKQYGLDKPVIVQYGKYMANLVQGNLGMSFKKVGYSVNTLIGQKFPISARIGASAAIIALVVGVPLGMIAAIKRNKILDRLIMFFSTVGIAIPSFVIATLLQYIFAMKLGLLPTQGVSSWQGYILPAITLAFYPMCYIARLMRASTLEVLGQDYIKTVRAKGMPYRVLVCKHALRNAILPVVTYAGPMIAGILVGGFVVEQVFNIPGLGKYFISSITDRDYTMVMGTTIFLSALVVLSNLVVDVLYSVIDPRIKLE